ncbi:scopoletin glucosyltransferase-like [Andrographis paniculata]|uniref:scopoletin glucosyltransferase-like n=1 Tax=Andrographis paniculata TaxID=175694 RepID=UPI0021E89997|nr:scopoletin glucosyltransferase-like [Andrographis paniculata]
MSAKPHIYLIPVMAPGHMIPMVDLARKLARLGARSTIITTPLNASHFFRTIERDRKDGFEVAISIVEFPCQEAGLPAGCENLSSTTTSEMTFKFIKAMDLFQEPVEKLLQDGDPNCIVAGAFFWWANDVAARLNIPRLVFYGTGCFPMCVSKCLKMHKENGLLDSEEFVVPGLPDEVKMSRRQLPEEFKEEDKSPFAETYKKIVAAESRSFGMVVNTFQELEPAYVRLMQELMGIKIWNVGPISLFYGSIEDKAHRGREASVNDDHQDCLNWLNSKKPDSVVYICFGSMARFSSSQLVEIAEGLRASGREFIWVVGELAGDDEWSPEGFERRLEGKGLIITGWAPQVLILEHEAVGGFITHCGWNSLLEGVAGGVPMVTWPLSAEQFFNEKFVVEILKIGIPVGVREWTRRTQEREAVKREDVEKAMRRLMGEEEGDELRIRAKNLRDSAITAVQKDGSSDMDLKCLIQEIRVYPESSHFSEV